MLAQNVIGGLAAHEPKPTSADSVISWMLACAAVSSASIARAAAMSFCRVWALRRSTRLRGRALPVEGCERASLIP